MTRNELELRLRHLIGQDCHHPAGCPSCEKRLSKVMRLIEEYAASDRSSRPAAELWNAEKVASYIGRNSTHSARAWLSQNNIRRITTQPHPESGRPQSLYAADEVRAVCFRKALT